MFTATLLDHFQNPRNPGELPPPAARAEASNPVCGDILQLSARIENGIIREVRFLCRGCTASIACASLLTETIKGRELAKIKDVHAASLVEALGGLPPASFHAAQLAEDALHSLLRAAPPL